jgi:hypothetical protein
VPDVEDLRQQLRDRGYLSRGIERWFALDPWSSRAFWAELATVVAKAATLIALFGSLPCVAIMLARNHPLTAVETLELFAIYAAAWFAIGFIVVIAVALLLKLRPEVAIETPRGLLTISIATSAVLIVPLAAWWYRFDTNPTTIELVTGGALAALFFIVSTIAVSAALLSFTIYELRRIPAIHQQPRGLPLTVAAVILIVLLFVPAYATPERNEAPPLQVVTTPTPHSVVLIAVDGLTYELARARPDLVGASVIAPVNPIPGASAPERWASVGTGVPPSLHRVHAVDGVRLAGGSHILQSVSRADFALRDVAPRVRLARGQPLPPTVRRRDYVWEILAGRGIPSVSVNWWTTDDSRIGALDSVSQTPIFAAATGARTSADSVAIRVDEAASHRLIAEVERTRPRFATVYLPALDIILNRLPLDPATRLAASVRALENVRNTIERMRRFGHVILIGLPGEGQSGRPVLGSDLPMTKTPSSAFDVAPTVYTLLGFPVSDEMPGKTLIGSSPRIATYGPRNATTTQTKVNEEYYDSLRSLGYIR